MKKFEKIKDRFEVTVLVGIFLVSLIAVNPPV